MSTVTLPEGVLAEPSPATAPGPSQERAASRGWSRPLALILLAVVVVFPLGVIFVAAFINGTPIPGAGALWTPTLEHVIEMAQSHTTFRALWNSVILAAGSTVLGVGFGTFMAWLAARSDVPMRRLVAFAGIIPLLVPAFIGAIAWSFLGAPRVGYIPMVLKSLGIDFAFNIYTMPGMLFVYSLYNVPLAFIFTFGALHLANPEMEDAASVHGATKFRTMLSITFPLLKPAVLSALLLTFVSTMEDFPVAMVLGYSNGIETLAARIFVTAGSAPPPVNANSAQAVLLMVVIVVLVALQRRMLRGQNFATVTGKGVRHRQVALGRWRWPALTTVLLYLGLSIGLPFSALLLGSLRPSLFARDLADLLDPRKMTVQPLVKAVNTPALYETARNTLGVSLLVALLGVAFAVFLAYAMRGHDTVPARLVHRLSMLPAAAPGVVLGMGMLWAYAALPISIYGTVWILVVAYICRFLPQSTSAVSSAMEGIHKDLEDAASVSGASRTRAVLWVTVPLLRSGLVATGLLLFILSTREISMSIFLYTPDNRTFAIYLYNLWSDGTWSALASMSFIFSMFTLLFVLLTRRWMAGARPS